jgi:hypothetical protein
MNWKWHPWTKILVKQSILGIRGSMDISSVACDGESLVWLEEGAITFPMRVVYWEPFHKHVLAVDVNS